MKCFNNPIKKEYLVRKTFLFLILAIILIPRIPIAPLGYGELSIRVDGVASALVGILALFVLSKRLSIILFLTILFLIYIHDAGSVILSAGLFFQVISIILLPVLFGYFNKKNINFYELSRGSLAPVIIFYALLNIIIAVLSRYSSFEYCVDSLSNTGCVGSYGFLDRPYVFSVFIGVAFVLVCAGTRFSYINALILLFGLLISDSRAIAVVMLILGAVVYFQFQRISLAKLLSFFVAAVILLMAVMLGEGKMSLENATFDEVDPSWLMRLHNIDLYMEWLDLSKLTIGGGALAFYQFSDAYGQPGPVDNLYIRLASEIGVIGVVILMFLYLQPLLRCSINRRRNLTFISYVVAVSFISVFQESLIVPRAGHVLVLLGIYLCCAAGTARSNSLLVTKHV